MFKYRASEYFCPGAKAQDFEHDPRVNAVLAWKHDFTLLWLGNNDIDVPEL